jgi:sarcosine oxidase
LIVTFETIVVGLGAMGSATLFHLARRGARVLGLDTYSPPHANGSSHGETRVIREAYFEHPIYVPLVQRAYELWSELERESGDRLCLQTGGLMIGRMESTVVSGAIRSAREHRLPHEILSASRIKERAPALHPDDDMAGVLEPRAGILFPERCIAAHLNLAQKAGAIIHTGERVLDWQSNANTISLRTDAGQYTAAKLVLTAGAWLPKLLPELQSFLQVERQVLLWFKSPQPELLDPAHLPIHLWEYAPGKMFYGFPDLGDGLKLAFHHQGEITSAAGADRTLRTDDIQKMRDVMARYLPRAARAEFLRGTVCLYTNTPDGHFILDSLPTDSNVIVASPCSGHGFKFASAIGEVVANITLGKPTGLNTTLFSLRRFSTGAPNGLGLNNDHD